MYYILPTRFIYDIVKLTKGFCIVDQQKTITTTVLKEDMLMKKNLKMLLHFA